MKLILLLFFLALISCNQDERINAAPFKIDPAGDPFKIDPAKPPNGMHMVQILLKNQMTPVAGTGCETDPEDKRPLPRYLAMMLGDAIDAGALGFKLSGGCKADQLETGKGPLIDIWRCNVGVSNIVTDKYGVIASAHIYFGITKNTWEFIPEKLMCL